MLEQVRVLGPVSENVEIASTDNNLEELSSNGKSESLEGCMSVERDRCQVAEERKIEFNECLQL